MDSHTILVLDEDTELLAYVSENLIADGYNTISVDNPAHALSMSATQFPDLAIVSVNGGSGRDIVQQIRAGATDTDPRLPLILTGRDRDALETVRNLNLGADDYLPKPFSYSELHARVGALLRRVELDAPNGTKVLRVGKIQIDVASRNTTVDSTPIDLSRKLHSLLTLLASEPHRVFTKQELMRQVWGHAAGSSRTLDSHACRLRHALAVHGDRYIQNVWGVGYRLLPND